MERRTARLLVRPLRPDDRAEYLRVLAVSDALHAPWNPRAPAELSPSDLFDRGLARVHEGSCVRFVGILADGRIGGFFNLNELVRGPFQNAYAGWSVNAEVAGTGIATEGVTALLDLAFAAAPDGVGLHRVQANVVPRNVRSVRVAEKCGFRREGLALRYLQIAGVWEDHLMFAKVADEHARAAP
jgi:ribosomal-protein-alanine N-acetyltransferase